MSLKVLITGATGYIGGKLLNHLSKTSLQLRALARFPDNLRSRLPSENIEIVQGDVLDYPSLQRSLEGVDIAYYFVHSMGAKKGFEELDKTGALLFAKAAAQAKVKKIIYLGGLGSSHGNTLSPHMRSRQEVGRLLASTGLAVLEFRSSIILGAGSLSYEMMKALVEKLPIMVAPRWIHYEVQPIHIDDVLAYLSKALYVDIAGHQIIQIAGSEKVSYKNFMLAYAQLKGLKRLIITVPFLTPGLSSLWLSLVTPVYKTIGRKLIESIVNDSVITDPSGQELFDVHPKSYKEALKICMQREGTSLEDRRWFDAVSSKGIVRNLDKVTFGKKKSCCYTAICDAPIDKVYAYIQTLGGTHGWYGEWMWRLRGLIDMVFGGPGFKRNRRDPEKLIVGDALDFWRVVEMKENEKILLKAEMKLPGLAFLNFELTPQESKTLLKIESFFLPVGKFGVFYWYLFAPFHEIIFPGLLRRIKKGTKQKP